MEQALPWIFTSTAAVACLLAFYALWMSLRLALADPSLQGIGGETESEALQGLQTEKEGLLEQIRDVAFEHEAGKLSDEDFAELNEKLRARARQVLIELDAAAQSHRDEAERMIAERMTGASGTEPTKDEGPQ